MPRSESVIGSSSSRGRKSNKRSSSESRNSRNQSNESKETLSSDPTNTPIRSLPDTIEQPKKSLDFQGKIISLNKSLGPIIYSVFLIFLPYWSMFFIFHQGAEDMKSILYANFPSAYQTYLECPVITTVFVFLVSTLGFTKFDCLGKKYEISHNGRKFELAKNGLPLFAVVLSCALFLNIGAIQKAFIRPDVLVLSNMPSVLTSFVIACFLLSFFSFFEFNSSKFLKGQRTKYLDYTLGRDVRPFVFGIDLKVAVGRVSYLTQTLFIIIMVYSEWDTKKDNPITWFALLRCLILNLDYFINEHAMLFSYEFNHQGCGLIYFLEKLILFTFFFNVNDVFYFKMASGNSIESEWSHFIVYFTVFLIGVTIRRIADNQKFYFKNSPNNPLFKGLKIIPSNSKRALFADGIWFYARHPNYFGTIIIYLSTALPFGFSSYIPWILPIYIMLYLYVKSFITENVVKKEYAIAYKEYTKIVPSRIIPIIL